MRRNAPARPWWLGVGKITVVVLALVTSVLWVCSQRDPGPVRWTGGTSTYRNVRP